MRLEVVSYTPQSQSQQTPILFLHGEWHGAWCWEDYFLPYFALKGFSAHAMSLRAHGMSEGRDKLRWLTVDDYVTDLVQVVRSLPQPPVIVAHSLGAFVLQKYLEHYDTPAAVLVAPAPARGGFRLTARAFRRSPRAMLRTTMTFSPYALVHTQELAHTAVFHNTLPRHEVEKHFKRLQGESFRVYLDFVAFSLPDVRLIREHPRPMLVLAAAEDRIFPPEEGVVLANAYGAEVTVLPDTAHDVMLDPNWMPAADHIIQWLRKTGIE
jgi:pimeloyl-ACP methyl ester carboxylesterase